MAFCEKCHNIFNVSDRIYVQHKGGINYAKLIEGILDEEIDAQQLKQINLDHLFSSKEVKELDEDEWRHLEDQIDKILATSAKMKGGASMNRTAYYVCNVCGFNKPIEPNTTVYTKIYTKVYTKVYTIVYPFPIITIYNHYARTQISFNDFRIKVHLSKSILTIE